MSFKNRALYVLVFLLIVTVSTAYSQKFGKISDEEWQTGPPVDYPEANAVILFDLAKMDVKLDVISIDYHIRIKVLNRAGIEEAAERDFAFYPDLDKVKGFKAHTITPDGKKLKVEKDAVFDKPIGKWTIREFAFPAVEPGCILEYKFTVKSKNHWFLDPRFFQNDIYTMRSEFALTLAPGFSYDIDYKNIPGRYREPEVTKRPDPSAGTGRFLKTYTWKMENLPPIKDEPYMASEDDYRSHMRFQLISFTNSRGAITTFVKDWLSLGDDFETYLGTYCNKQGQIEELAKQVTINLITPREQSAAIFRHVATEYKTVQDYHSRWPKHDKLSELLEEKQGRGADKNMLLVQMHRALGLDAWPVLISTRDNGQFSPRFPSLQQFNNLLCFVQFGQEWEFLDAAFESAPYGLLPPNCLADGGFLVDGDQSSLVRMTIKPVPSVRTDLTRMRVFSDGSAACSTLSSFTGYYASAYGERYETTEPKDFVEDYYTDRLDGECVLADYRCQLDSTNKFVAECNYASTDLTRQLDNNILIESIQFSFTENPFKSEKRTFPVDFQYPFVYRNQVEIFSDAEAAEFVKPEDVTFEISGASFERKSLVTDSSVVITSALTVTEPVYRPARYRALRDFFDKVALASEDEAAIVLAGEM